MKLMLWIVHGIDSTVGIKLGSLSRR